MSKPYNHLSDKNQPVLTTRKAIKKFIDQSLERHRLETKQDFKYCRLALEFEKHMEERRIKAVLNSMEHLKSEHRMCIDEWVMMNIQCDSFNLLESTCHILLGASIWILDYILDSGVSVDELYKLLPRDRDKIKPLIRKNLSVSGYSTELTASVEYVLKYRNSDIPSTPSCNNDTKRTLTNNFSAAGLIDHTVPSRQNFEKLLALIPQDRIDSAVSKFKECYDEWCRRYLYGIRYFVESLNQVTNELNQNKNKSNVMMKVLDNIKLNAQMQAFKNCMLLGDGFTEEFCNKTFEGKFIELIKPMPIADPYEMCFALLYLIEQDSDIPWLYGSCLGTFRSYWYHLPWCAVKDDTDNKIECKLPSWYELPHRYKNDVTDCDFDLAHVICTATGTVMPRHIKNTDEILRVFNTYNIDVKDSLDEMYMLNALRETKECIPALNLDEEYMSKLCNVEDKAPPVDTDELQSRINELEQEVKHLQSKMHDAEKKTSDVENEYNEFKEEVKNEQRELYDLREIIFTDTADTVDEAPVDDKKYPYEVQHNTVIFGGFDNWRNEIKPLLKGKVRLIPRDIKNFDVSIIRNADIIWIQINSISHSSYYKIINTAKPYNKPIRYFGNQSVMKCVEQLADYDTSI